MTTKFESEQEVYYFENGEIQRGWVQYIKVYKQTHQVLTLLVDAEDYLLKDIDADLCCATKDELTAITKERKHYYFTVLCGNSHKPSILLKWDGWFDSKNEAKYYAHAFTIMAHQTHKTAGCLIESEDEEVDTVDWNSKWDYVIINDLRIKK